MQHDKNVSATFTKTQNFYPNETPRQNPDPPRHYRGRGRNYKIYSNNTRALMMFN